MKDLRFDRRTPFAVVTTVIHRGTAGAYAQIELTLASGSLRLVFRDAEALQVFTSAFSQLTYDTITDPRVSSVPAIASRVFCRDDPDGRPRPLRGHSAY